MDVRQMRYLIAVADELNFTRAAERCNVSQPPLSRAISQLEDEIGVRLFERDTHGVTTTLAGQSLVEDARRALTLIREGAERARQVAHGLRGTLAIGFGGSPVYSLLPALVHRFRQAVPDVQISFRSMAVLRQIDALREGEIHIGIVRLPVHDEVIETQFVHREPLLAALPANHPILSGAPRIRIGDLARDRFVTYEPRRGFNYHADLFALCRLAGFEPDVAHEVGTTESIIGIVACGEGVAIVPASAERLRMRGVAFRPLDITDVPPRLSTVEFALAWHRDRLTAAAAEFIQRAAIPGAGTS